MATLTETTGAPTELATARRSSAVASWAAFRALLLRDFTVLRKNLAEFIPRTVLQPFLLVFVFTYVFPKIGQGIGGGGTDGASESAFATLLVAGVVGVTILFQGIQAVALPMVQEFGFTKEIEDRVLAPLPVWLVAMGKVASGAIQGLIAAVIVFPIAAVVPASPVHLKVSWLVLLTLVPLVCVTASAMGLMFGTLFQPRTVPMMFGVVVIPITFLGCVYYSWTSLETIRWLQIAVLANPLVYMSEGFRAALTEADHMSLWAVYAALAGFCALFLSVGVRGFRKRVLS